MFSRKQAFAIFLALGLFAPVSGHMRGLSAQPVVSKYNDAPAPAPCSEDADVKSTGSSYEKKAVAPDSYAEDVKSTGSSYDAKKAPASYEEEADVKSTGSTYDAKKVPASYEEEADVKSTGSSYQAKKAPASYEEEEVKSAGTGYDSVPTPCPTTAAPESDVKSTGSDETPCPDTEAEEEDCGEKLSMADDKKADNKYDGASKPEESSYNSNELSASSAAALSSGFACLVAAQVAFMMM